MKISSNISWQRLRNGAYIIDETCNSIIKIEGISMEIWCMISERRAKKYIIDNIIENYNIDESTVSNDVDQVIADLMERGYLTD